MTNIHPTTIVEKGAKIDPSAQIGPYCIVGKDVAIGANTRLTGHVNVSGKTTIGTHCTIHPFASLGTPPQDLKYNNEPSQLIIGDHTTIREHVTMNTGTQGGGMVTRVGSHCLFMVSAHVAHDCQVGNHVILANNATLAGHVHVGDHAIIGGLSAVHQFVRIGEHAMIGGMSGVEHDVIPFGSVMGERASLAGLNLVGLKRRGFSRDAIHSLRKAYREIFEGTKGTLNDRASTLIATTEFEEVKALASFVAKPGPRNICIPQAPLEEDAAA